MERAEARYGLERLLAIMNRLRDPERGCPWDLQQSFASIAPNTIEEAYEVVDAIDRRDWADLRDELGDLLLQVVFHAQLAKEAGFFEFADVVHAISDKMIRRHPHVFGDAVYENVAQRKQAWEAIKAEERARKGEALDSSALAGVSTGQPEWKRAQKLQERAASVGFEWPTVAPLLEKLHEEGAELSAEFAGGGGPERLQDELGDVLFVAVNLARRAEVDFSAALRHANAKFERRFRSMEALARADGRDFAELDLAAQEALWRRAKQTEKPAG